MSHTKNLKPKTQIFLLQTWRLAKSFEGLNSSLVQSSAEIFPLKHMCKLLDFCANRPTANMFQRELTCLQVAVNWQLLFIPTVIDSHNSEGISMVDRVLLSSSRPPGSFLVWTNFIHFTLSCCWYLCHELFHLWWPRHLHILPLVQIYFAL